MIRELVERIEVFSHRSREQDRRLWDDGQLGPQIVQSQRVYLDAVDLDAALVDGEPEQGLHDGRLSRSGPAHHSDLCASSERTTRKVLAKTAVTSEDAYFF